MAHSFWENKVSTEILRCFLLACQNHLLGLTLMLIFAGADDEIISLFVFSIHFLLTWIIYLLFIPNSYRKNATVK